MDTVSVVVPCYNLETHIRSAVKSIQDQTHTNLEIILVNDGSSDNTLDVLFALKEEDRRIKVVTKPNGGVSSTRNVGIKHASGTYLYFFDGDDYLEPDALEKAISIIKTQEVDMVSFGYKNVNAETNEVLKHYSNEKYNQQIFTGEQFIKHFFLKKIEQHVCSFVVKRSVISENALWFDEDTHRGEDDEFQIACLMHTDRVFYLSEEWFHYVFREGSSVNQPFIRKNFDVYKRIEGIVSQALLPYYYDYLTYKYIYVVRDILKKGSNKETVSEALKMDVALKRYHYTGNKYDVHAFLFKVAYRLFLKSKLKKKYGLT